MNALIGKKLGMTQIFDDNGHQVPVTVLEVGPCTVVQRKTSDVEGYDAVQLGFLDQKERRLTKPLAGHYKKNGLSPKRITREVRIEQSDDEVKVGDTVTAADVFQDVEFVDVIGTSKGRGFQGVVKRHGMSGGRGSHGSHMHRRTGSIGMCVSPARVLKGKRMPGQMGNSRVMTQNLKVVGVRGEDNVILVRGSVPGPTGGIVFVRKAIKKAAKAS